MILFSDYRGIVFLFIHAGGQWIYGAGSLCHGQTAAEDWIIWAFLCANAHWVWMYSTSRYGNPDIIFGTGSENDGFIDAIYVMQREASHIFCIFNGLFSGASSPGDDPFIYRRNGSRSYQRLTI